VSDRAKTGIVRRASRETAFYPIDHVARTPIQRPIEADSQSPRPSKRPTCRRHAKCGNGFRAKGKSPIRVLADGSRCLGTHLAAYRGGFTVAAPVETPDVSQTRQVRKRISREGEVVDTRSSRWITLLGHASSGPSRQIRDRRARRNPESPHIRRVRKWVSRKGEAGDKRSGR
jgi:hypothetical protein